MSNSLTTQERAALVIQHKSERDKRICDRIKAVLLHDKGYSYTKIAEILLLDDETVRRHVNDYFIKKKLAPKNGGSVSRMSLKQAELLKAHLREKTYLYVKEICAYVQSELALKYTQSGMTKWLKANGFRYKKPHGIPAKADKTKQEAFVEYYEKLKCNLPKDEVIYFLDASHPQHQTKLACGWIEKGVRKPEKMTACQKRVNLIAGINLANHHVEYAEAKWINGESIEAFLKQLISAQPTAKKYISFGIMLAITGAKRYVILLKQRILSFISFRLTVLTSILLSAYGKSCMKTLHTIVITLNLLILPKEF